MKRYILLLLALALTAALIRLLWNGQEMTEPRAEPVTEHGEAEPTLFTAAMTASHTDSLPPAAPPLSVAQSLEATVPVQSASLPESSVIPEQMDLTEPPGLNAPSLPTSLSTEVAALVNALRCTGGPGSKELGKRLLNSEDPSLRLAGVMLLMDLDALDADAVNAILKDASMTTPFNAIGLLSDGGRIDEAALLAELLGEQLTDPADQLAQLLNSGDITDAGSRAVLDLINRSLPKEEAQAFYTALATDASLDYGVRMKAIYLMRETLDFTTFRDTVNSIQNNAADNDALWQDGLSLLTESIEGPAVAHAGAATLTAGDIEMLTAREHPMHMEDLAQYVEYVVRQDNAYVQEGTTAALVQQLEELESQPLSDADQLVMTRLLAATNTLSSMEQPVSAAPSSMPEAPPGSCD